MVTGRNPPLPTDTRLPPLRDERNVSRIIEGKVLFVVSPDELGEHELTDELRELAATEDQHVLVCREGGHPSWPERIWSFLRRKPIEAVTVLADTDHSITVGEEISVRVTETELASVYVATGPISRQ